MGLAGDSLRKFKTEPYLGARKSERSTKYPVCPKFCVISNMNSEMCYLHAIASYDPMR